MALIRIPVKKYLVAGAISGMMAVTGAGLAGAAGTAPTTGAPPGSGHSMKCTTVQADLARMRHRQAELSAKVAKLSRSESFAARAGKKKAHRAAVIRRNLAHWEKVQSRRIDARFLRKEAKLAALAAGQCQGATPTAAPRATASV
jgi:hypothetical protein